MQNTIKLSTKVFKFFNKKTKENYFTEAYNVEDALKTLSAKIKVDASDLKKVIATSEELKKCWSDKTKQCYTVVAEETLNEDDFIKKKKIEHATKELRNAYDVNLRKQYLSLPNDTIKLKAIADGDACYNTGWTLTPNKLKDENGNNIPVNSIFRFKSEKEMFEKVRAILIDADAMDIQFNKDLTCGEAIDYLEISRTLNQKQKNA